MKTKCLPLVFAIKTFCTLQALQHSTFLLIQHYLIAKFNFNGKEHPSFSKGRLYPFPVH